MILATSLSVLMLAQATCQEPHVQFTNSDLCVPLSGNFIQKADGTFETQCVLKDGRCVGLPEPRPPRVPVKLTSFTTNNDNPRAGWNLVQIKWKVQDSDLCMRKSNPQVRNFTGIWIPTTLNRGEGTANVVFGSQSDAFPRDYTLEIICYGSGQAGKGTINLRTRVR